MKNGLIMMENNLCPRFEKAMEIISKRWVGLILFELLKGPKRFSEMETNLPVSGRLLSERLKLLEKEAIVTRTVYSEYPVRIKYSLTDKGKSLEPAFHELQSRSEERRVGKESRTRRPAREYSINSTGQDGRHHCAEWTD